MSKNTFFQLCKYQPKAWTREAKCLNCFVVSTKILVNGHCSAGARTQNKEYKDRSAEKLLWTKDVCKTGQKCGWFLPSWGFFLQKMYIMMPLIWVEIVLLFFGSLTDSKEGCLCLVLEWGLLVYWTSFFIGCIKGVISKSIRLGLLISSTDN